MNVTSDLGHKENPTSHLHNMTGLTTALDTLVQCGNVFLRPAGGLPVCFDQRVRRVGRLDFTPRSISFQLVRNETYDQQTICNVRVPQCAIDSFLKHMRSSVYHTIKRSDGIAAMIRRFSSVFREQPREIDVSNNEQIVAGHTAVASCKT